MATVAGGETGVDLGERVIFNSYAAVGGCTFTSSTKKSVRVRGDSARSGPGREKGTTYLGRCSRSRKGTE